MKNQSAWWSAWTVWVGCGLFMLYSLLVLHPAHDEIITLLNMRNHAGPAWDAFGSVAEHQKFFQGPLAQFSDIGPMLKKTDVHPPFYYHVALAWSYAGGDSLVGLRLLSWLFVMVGFACVLFSARRLIGEPHGWVVFWIACAVASASSIAYAGVSARSYGLVFLLSVVLTEGLVRWVDRSIPRWAAAGVLCAAGALLMWTHYFGVIAVFAAWLVAFGAAKTWAERRVWALGVVATGLLALPLLGWVSVHFGARSAQYAGFWGWLWELVFVGRILAEQVTFVTTSVWSFPLLLMVSVLLVWSLVQAWRSPRNDHGVTLARALSVFVAIGMCCFLLLFWWTDKTMRTSDSSRYGMFIGPALLLSVGLVARGRVWLLAVPVALGLTSWVAGSRIIQPWEWHDAFALSLPELARGDTAVVLNDGMRGVAGNIVFRADKGWIGFADADAAAIAQTDRKSVV